MEEMEVQEVQEDLVHPAELADQMELVKRMEQLAEHQEIQEQVE